MVFFGGIYGEQRNLMNRINQHMYTLQLCGTTERKHTHILTLTYRFIAMPGHAPTLIKESLPPFMYANGNGRKQMRGNTVAITHTITTT